MKCIRFLIGVLQAHRQARNRMEEVSHSEQLEATKTRLKEAPEEPVKRD